MDDGSWIYPGCTDDGNQSWSPFPGESAWNYDDKANEDDGNCEYLGCMVEGAVNYDAKYTNAAYAMCVFEGCTDPNSDTYIAVENEACRYNVNLCNDNGSCQYFGCTSSISFNYDETATVDNGCCGPEAAFISDQMMSPQNWNGQIMCNGAANICVCKDDYQGEGCNYRTNFQIEFDKFNQLPTNTDNYTTNGGSFSLNAWIDQFEILQSQIDVYLEWETNMYNTNKTDCIPSGYGIQ